MEHRSGFGSFLLYFFACVLLGASVTYLICGILNVIITEGQGSHCVMTAEAEAQTVSPPVQKAVVTAQEWENEQLKFCADGARVARVVEMQDEHDYLIVTDRSASAMSVLHAVGCRKCDSTGTTAEKVPPSPSNPY